MSATLDPCTVALTGRHLVEASAGTGKTFTIAALFLRLIVEDGLRPEQILVVTYTEAAAAELRGRLRERLMQAHRMVSEGPGPADAGADEADDRSWPDPVLQTLVTGWEVAGRAAQALDRLEDALAGFDLAPVSTIHGFCSRALRDHAFASGVPFDTELVDDAPFLDTLTRDLWTAATYPLSEAVVARLDDRVTLSDVGEVVRKALSAAPRTVRPAEPPEVDVDAALQRVAEAHAAAATAWADHGPAAIEATTNGLFNRRSYSPKKVEATCATLAALFAGEAPATLSRDHRKLLDRYTPEALESKVSKGKVGTLPDARETHGLFDAIAGLVEAYGAVDGAVDTLAVALLRRVYDDAPAALDRLREDGTWFFEDLLSRLQGALAGPAGPRLARRLRQACPAALIDEFQDTDPVQYDIFRTIYGGDDGPEPRLYLIGDPKQAIYAFRGADLHTYLRAREELVEQAHHLGTNHRSDRSMVEAMNHLFRRVDDVFQDPRVTAEAVDARHADGRLLDGEGAAVPPVEVRLLTPDDRSSRFKLSELIDQVAEDVVDTLHAGLTVQGRPLAPGDLAVLVARHKTAEAIQDALVSRGVPAVRYGRASVFDTAERLYLISLLEAVLTPSDPVKVKSALGTPLMGWDAEALAALDTDAASLQRWLGRLRDWRDLWQERGLPRLVQAVLDDAEVGLRRRVLARPGGERQLTNLRHLTELAHRAAHDRRLGPRGVLTWLRHAHETEDARQEQHQLRLESDGEAVQLVTMHSSKGLEYPVVFLPELWRGPFDMRLAEFHDPEADDALVLDLAATADSPAGQAWLAEQRAERMRLAYVSLTRAKHHQKIYAGRDWSGDCTGSPLADLWLPGLDDKARKDFATWEDAVQAYQASDPDRVRVSLAVPGGHTPWRRPVEDAEVLRDARSIHLERGPDVRVSSFSGLIAGGQGSDDGHDHDHHAGLREGLRPTTPVERGPVVTLARFPRGPVAGTAVHAVLEELDFGDPDGEASRSHLHTTLGRHGLTSADGALLRRGLAEVLATPLADDGFRLADLPRDQRLDELGFVMPAGRMQDSGAPSRLTPAALAQPFADHGGPLLSSYAPRVAGLRFGAMWGVLKGFADLIYVHDGRWWVVDYKTNHLGDRRVDYVHEALHAEMVEAHYVLQAHIYLLALHRFLSLRLADYDYDQHIGGLQYLFLRGMHPDTGPTHGVWTHRPDRALVDALDAALRGGAP